jgi:hypothetical protein
MIVWPLAPLYAVAKSLTDVYSTLRRKGYGVESYLYVLMPMRL